MFIKSCDMEPQDATKAAEKVTVNAAVVAKSEVVFNPFQRGNGCLLAGYTAKEILAHTR